MISLELAKKYCRIDGNSDDEILTVFIISSLSEISRFCNRLFFQFQSDFDEVENNLSDIEKQNALIIENLSDNEKEKINLARLKLICDWYEYRGNVVELSLDTAPYGVRDLLQPYFIYNLVAD